MFLVSLKSRVSICLTRLAARVPCQDRAFHVRLDRLATSNGKPSGLQPFWVFGRS